MDSELIQPKPGTSFDGGPVVKNSPCNAGDKGLIPCWGTKIPHIVEQVSPSAPTPKPTTSFPRWHNKDPMGHS